MNAAPASPDRRTIGRLSIALVLLTLIHTIAVWGYSGPFSGDTGRWLHEVDRLAQGEVLYRDFIWIFLRCHSGCWVRWVACSGRHQRSSGSRPASSAASLFWRMHAMSRC